MSFHIEVTAEQARAIAALAEEKQAPVALRQLVTSGESPATDVYATVHGASEGFRIARDGSVSRVGEVLPAP